MARAEEFHKAEVEGWTSVRDDGHRAVEGVDELVDGLDGGVDSLVLCYPRKDVSGHLVSDDQDVLIQQGHVVHVDSLVRAE